MIQGFKKIRLEEGMRGLTLGWLPTLIGYSMQGFGKFGFYEIFKDVNWHIVGEENATKYRKVVWSISSASAELIADCFLCPMEAVKVRM
jgi:solute carrier family 25 phosphate transporter 3